MKVDNIYKLIEEISKLNVTSFEYEEDGKRIALKFDNSSKPVKVKEEGIDEEYEIYEPKGDIVTSPIVGTFYASGTEGGTPFVSEGEEIKKGDVVAIIEAMKLMNEIKSEYTGTVKTVLVKNGEPVEFGQPLFEII